MAGAMTTYLLFGIEGDSLNDARAQVEAALEIKMELHESGYRGGEYYRLHDVGREHFILQRNYDDLEGEWTDPSCKDCGILLYANEVERYDTVCAALAGIARLVSQQEI